MKNLNQRVEHLENRSKPRGLGPAENVLALAEEHPEMPDGVINAAREHLASPPTEREATERRLMDEMIAHNEFFASLIWDEQGNPRS